MDTIGPIARSVEDAAALLQVLAGYDRVGTEPILLVVGGDNRSVRAFRQRLPGLSGAPQFYRIVDNASQLNELISSALLIDAQTGSQWNF